MLILLAFLAIIAFSIIQPNLKQSWEPPHIIKRLRIKAYTNGGFFKYFECLGSTDKPYKICCTGYWRDTKSRALADCYLDGPVKIPPMNLSDEELMNAYEVWIDGYFAKDVERVLINAREVDRNCVYDPDDREYRCGKFYDYDFDLGYKDKFNCWYEDGKVECQRFVLKLPDGIIDQLREGFEIYSIAGDRDEDYGYVDGRFDIDGYLNVKIRVECTEDEHCPGAAPYCNPDTYKCVECLVDEHCPEGYECVNNRCEKIDPYYCEKDEDCVPEQCCHPTSCINKAFAPDCRGVICTAECVPGTMDCGQGYCACINNRCQAIITTTTAPTTTTTIPECTTDEECKEKYRSCDAVCKDGKCIILPVEHPPKTCPDGTVVEWLDYPICDYPPCPEKDYTLIIIGVILAIVFIFILIKIFIWR